MKVNFYWSGNEWTFIHRLTIVSHLRVGHEVIMWVHDEPNKKNLYWVDDLPVEIKKAKKYVDTAELLKQDWNLRTISTLFQYECMIKTGNYTADCDAIALKHWPDIPLVNPPDSVGVLRIPKNHEVLKCAIEKANKIWGNVRIFTHCCMLYGLETTHEEKEFYPLVGGGSVVARHLLRDVEIPDCYSYHVYTNSPQGRNITPERVKDNSLLKKLSDFSFGDEYSLRRGIKENNL